MKAAKLIVLFAMLWVAVSLLGFQFMEPIKGFVVTNDIVPLKWLSGAYHVMSYGFGIMLVVLAFFAWESTKKSRVIQDQRFFVQSTIGIEEMVRQTYARLGAEEGVARKEVAELALEGETMNEALQAIPGAQARIVRRRRYAAIAASFNIKVAAN